MYRSLPPIAIVLGVGGLVPFLVFGLGAVGGDTPRPFAMLGLLAYGAVILSFLGGVHWGFVLAGEDDDKPAGTRLSLGVVPSLIGWAAVLISSFANGFFSLAALIAGFVASVMIEHRASKRDLVPPGYMALRWGLSMVVILMLTSVLVLRLFGARIML
jgi:hypothetical protein